MSPILKGIVASGISGHLSNPGGYESIASFTTTTSTSDVTFTSIPQTYKHLELRVFLSSTSATDVQSYVTLNGDSSANNYTRNIFAATETAVQGNSTDFGSYTGWTSMYMSKDSTTYPSVGIHFFNEYANTNKKKIMQSFYGNESNASGIFAKTSSQWNQYTAISTIKFAASSGTFAAGSVLALYGLRGDVV
jgi:hypothetical protein